MRSRAEKAAAVPAGLYLAGNDSQTTVATAADRANTMVERKQLPPLPNTRPVGADDDADIPSTYFSATGQDATSFIGSTQQPETSMADSITNPHDNLEVWGALPPMHLSERKNVSFIWSQPSAMLYGGDFRKPEALLGVEEYTGRDRLSQMVSAARSVKRQSMLGRSMRSISTASLTPSEMLYPPPALYQPSERRASRILGLSGREHPSTIVEARETWDASIPNLPISEIEAQPFNDSEPLDGGRLAWAHAWAGFFVCFNCWGLNNAFGVFQAYYTHVLLHGTSPSKVAWIGSIQLFLVFFLGTPIGKAVDMGYLRIFFNLGSFLLVAFVLATSFCTKYWQFVVVQGVCTGVSMGMIFCSGIVVLMSYFSKNIGLAMGLAAAGSSVGAIVYTIAAQRLLPAVGFAWTIRYLAVIALVTLVIPNAIVRPRRFARRRPTQIFDWTVFRDISYLLMAAGMFFAFWGVYFGFYYIVSYGVDVLHLNSEDAVNLLVAMNAANLPGRLIPGLISDRCIGPLNTLIPSTFISAMLIFLWTAGSSTHSSLMVVACFYGFASAGIQALYAPVVYSFNHDPATMGVRAGIVFTVVSFGCLTGTPIGGQLIRAANGDYFGAQMFAGCSLLIAGVVLLVSRFVKAGWTAQRA